MARHVHQSNATRLAALLLVALIAGGCQGHTSAGTPFRIGPTRVLESAVDVDLYTAHQVARDVLEYEYLYLVERDTIDGREGVIEARTAKRHPVTVWTTRGGEQQTRVRIFVGPLGNTTAEAELFAAIERRSGTGSRDQGIQASGGEPPRPSVP